MDRRGFTLIELLVVVAIVAILLAIAIPQYSRYKRGTIDTAIENNVHSARVAMEAAYGSNDYSYVGIDQPKLVEMGYRNGQGFTLEIENLTTTSYVLRGCMTGGNFPSFVYDSDVGGLVGSPSGCS